MSKPIQIWRFNFSPVITKVRKTHIIHHNENHVRSFPRSEWRNQECQKENCDERQNQGWDVFHVKIQQNEVYYLRGIGS